MAHVADALNGLAGREAGKHCLIVGGGPSAGKAKIPYSEHIKHEEQGGTFTIAINGAFQLQRFAIDLPDYALFLDYDEPRVPWLADLYALPCQKVLSHILREEYPEAVHVKLSEDEPSIRRAKLGLFMPLHREGAVGTRRPGTTALNAIHLAGILGAAKVSLIGVDLSFPDGPKGEHHAYPCRQYGEFVTMAGEEMQPYRWRFGWNGKRFRHAIYTCDWFRESARELTAYRETCNEQGMIVNNYSSGLLDALGWKTYK